MFGIFTCSHITFVIVYSFYFLCFGSRRNDFNSFWRREGGEVRSLLLIRKISLSGNFIYLPHITFVIVYSFYFLCFGSRRNEYNSLWRREGGEIRSLLLAWKVSLSGNFINLFPHYIYLSS